MRAAIITCLIITALIAGCGYTLQSRSNLPFDEVSIGAITNSTVEPKLQDRMNRLLAGTLMEYGIDVRPSAVYRLEGTISQFNMTPVSEKSLTAIEYQITVVAKFDIVNVQTQKKETLLNVSSPFITYFRSSGALVSVLAQKEAATESALKDLSQEVVRRMIYKKPPSLLTPEDAEKNIKEMKGEQRVEP